MKKIKIDSLIANVRQLEPVLETLQNELGLKIFMKRLVPIGNKRVPMALVNVGALTLEFLEYASTDAFEEVTGIKNITLELPLSQSGSMELEPDLQLNINPGATPRLQAVEISSRDVSADLNILTALGATPLSDPRALLLGETELHFSDHPQKDKVLHPIRSFDELSHQAGWRRLSLQGPQLPEMIRFLEEQGCETIQDVFEVMPGLYEAFMRTPSGLILQPVKQQLWKLVPATIFEKIVNLGK